MAMAARIIASSLRLFSFSIRVVTAINSATMKLILAIGTTIVASPRINAATSVVSMPYHSNPIAKESLLQNPKIERIC